MNQETFIVFFIVFILIVIIAKYLINKSKNVSYVKSNINNKYYVVRNMKDKQKAADLLARITINLSKIVNYVKKTSPEELQKKYYTGDDEKSLNYIKSCQKLLISNYNPDNISESAPDAEYTSYSVNKGEQLIFCLRKKKAGDKLVSLNTMMFVSIHELGHLMTASIGHTPEFWENFKILLKISIDIGVYKYVDFRVTPVKYCSLEITDSPLTL
tara:strand:- start:1781 stop:2422 length:642 start_codon:yes stop_codon:yes gene_type:complete